VKYLLDHLEMLEGGHDPLKFIIWAWNQAFLPLRFGAFFGFKPHFSFAWAIQHVFTVFPYRFLTKSLISA